MATTLEHIPDRDLEERLDELIPPPGGALRTLVLSAPVVGVAIAVAILTIGGYLYPRPTFGSSFSSGSYLEVDQDRDAVSATVVIPNFRNRAVRITDIRFHGPGADLVDVGAFLEPPDETQTSDSGDEASIADASAGTELLPRGVTAMPLPVTVPAGRSAMIVVWFRPTVCIDQPGPWGTVDATVDFGDGAFPPFSNTVSLAEDPVAFVDPDATSDDGGATVMLRNIDGSFSTVSGPLAGACEALR